MWNTAYGIGRHWFIAVLLTVFALAPLGAYAQTSDIATLIAQLQAQIAALQAQINALQTQQSDSTPFCYTFNTNLRIGDSGEGVVALSTALGMQGFSAGMEEKGIFGETIASAVTGFQEKYRDEILTPVGLKYGNGFVGKNTRAKLNQLYGCNVTPIPIPANQPPIFSIFIPGASNNNLVLGENYSFEANVSSSLSNARVIVYLQRSDGTFKYDANNDVVAREMSLEYRKYTDQLGNWNAASGPRRLGDVGQTGIWRLWVTVGGIQSNKIYLNVFSPTKNQPPVISGVSGPTQLAVGQQGTWTVSASDPESGSLSYGVVWGDEEVIPMPPPIPFSTAPVLQTATFTHTYSQAGTYRPAFQVTDNAGKNAQTSISVNVGQQITQPLAVSSSEIISSQGSQATYA